MMEAVDGIKVVPISSFQEEKEHHNNRVVESSFRSETNKFTSEEHHRQHVEDMQGQSKLYVIIHTLKDELRVWAIVWTIFVPGIAVIVATVCGRYLLEKVLFDVDKLRVPSSLWFARELYQGEGQTKLTQDQYIETFQAVEQGINTCTVFLWYQIVNILASRLKGGRSKQFWIGLLIGGALWGIGMHLFNFRSSPFLSLAMFVYAMMTIPSWIYVIARKKKTICSARGMKILLRCMLIPLAIEVLFVTASSYILFARFWPKASWVEFLIAGFGYPSIQMITRKFFVEISLRIKGAADKGQADNLFAPLQLGAELILSTPGFIVLFLTADAKVFFPSFTVALLCEIFESMVVIKTMLQWTKIQDRYSYHSRLRSSGPRSPQTKDEINYFNARLSVMYSNHEAGEKLGLLLSFSMAMFLTGDIPSMIVRGLFAISLETISDVCKHYLYRLDNVYLSASHVDLSKPAIIGLYCCFLNVAALVLLIGLTIGMYTNELIIP